MCRHSCLSLGFKSLVRRHKNVEHSLLLIGNSVVASVDVAVTLTVHASVISRFVESVVIPQNYRKVHSACLCCVILCPFFSFLEILCGRSAEFAHYNGYALADKRCVQRLHSPVFKIALLGGIVFCNIAHSKVIRAVAVNGYDQSVLIA